MGIFLFFISAAFAVAKPGAADEHAKLMLEFQFQKAAVAAERCLDEAVEARFAEQAVVCALGGASAYRHILNLPAARAHLLRLEAKARSVALAADQRIQIQMERTLVEYEAGGAAIADPFLEKLKMMIIARNGRLGGHYFAPYSIVYMTVHPELNVEKQVPLLRQLEAAWKDTVRITHPSVLFWLHLAEGRALRRMRLEYRAGLALEKAERALRLRNPDLGWAEMRFEFEVVVQNIMWGRNDQAKAHLAKMKALWGRSDAPKTYARAIALLERFAEGGLTTRELLREYKKFEPELGPGHFMRDGFRFLFERA